MSAESRKLDVGAVVFTDYSGKLSQHTITERKEGTCQSGIMFRVAPCVKGGGGINEWFDADWFESIRLLGNVRIKRD